MIYFITISQLYLINTKKLLSKIELEIILYMESSNYIIFVIYRDLKIIF